MKLLLKKSNLSLGGVVVALDLIREILKMDNILTLYQIYGKQSVWNILREVRILIQHTRQRILLCFALIVLYVFTGCSTSNFGSKDKKSTEDTINNTKQNTPNSNPEEGSTQNSTSEKVNEIFSLEDFFEGKEFIFAGLPADIEESDVIRKYGKPQIYHSGESFEDRAYTTDNSVVISYFGVDIRNKVLTLKVSESYTGYSSKGIKINSSKDDLLKAYGNPSYVYENEFRDSETTYYYGNNERYFYFHLENNHIRSMGWLIDDDNHIIQNKLTGNVIKKYIELVKIIPAKRHFTWYYNGSLDTGKVITIDDIKEEPHGIEILTKSCREDRSGEVPLEKLISSDKYVIEDNKIFYNDNIILQNPIQVGNSWTHEFTLSPSNTKGNAKTTITDIHGKLITTETIVSNLEGFKDKIYKEINIYEEGKGLIEKKYNVPKIEDFTMHLLLDKYTEKPLNTEKWYLR